MPVPSTIPPKLSDQNQPIGIMRDANKLGSPHATDVYSAPRVASMAKRVGLRVGCALDLTTFDVDGNTPWNFKIPEKRYKAATLIHNTCPTFPVLRQTRKAFSPSNT